MKTRVIWIFCLLAVLGLAAFLRTTNREKNDNKSPFDESFVLEKLTLTAKRGPSLVITDPTTLKKIHHLINHSNCAPFEANPAGGYNRPLVCEPVFSGQPVVEYSGSLHFYRDRMYLAINLNQDEGFMSGPVVLARLDTELESSVLSELRKTFLKNSDQIQEWKPPIGYENTGSQPQ